LGVKRKKLGEQQHDQMLNFERQQSVWKIRVLFASTKRIVGKLEPRAGEVQVVFDIQSRSLSTCLRWALIGTDAYNKGGFVR
jgi:hypothetical protein